MTNIERVVTVEQNNVYTYLETSTEALVIRTPNGIVANFLGSINGADEGKAIFHHDVQALGNFIHGYGATSIQSLLGDKQAKVANVSDTEIGYLDGVTSAIQTQLDNKIPYESVGSTRKTKLYGINLFSFETFVNPSIGYVSPLHIDITNIQGNSYIENTVVIPYLRSPTSMWIEGDLHLVSANVHANNKIVSSDKISYLSNVTYDIQSQLNKCQPKFVALDPLEQIMDNEVVGNEILETIF